MIENRDTKQSSFLGNYVYNAVVPKDHILRKIDEAIDFSFVDKLARDAYCPVNGRPGYSPILMFKLVFLQFLYDLSDYEIESELNDRLSFKMFAGLEVEEAPPDHSTISRFRDRLGVDRFKEIFNRIVAMAKEKGIVTDKLHIIDSTDVKAKVDLYRLKKEHKEKEPDTYIDNHSPDKDARPGRKHKNKQFYGFKAHAIIDAESEILLNVDATPGNAGDGEQLTALSAPLDPPKVITADKAYDSKENHEHLSKNHIRNGIILRKNHTKRYIKEHIERVSNIAKKVRPVIEHKLSELKNRHGLGLARYLGLIKMRIQTYLSAICVNIKRMIRLIFCNASPPKIRLRRASS